MVEVRWPSIGIGRRQPLLNVCLKAAGKLPGLGGDISLRKNGRLLICVVGWLPIAHCEANTAIADEPGNRAVAPSSYLWTRSVSQ